MRLTLFVVFNCLFCSLVVAACKDTVVLVHGNTASTSSWNTTVNLLQANGYSSQQISLPNWGSKTCAACNNHSGSEETPVRNAISNAIANSCTGKIDVIGHSMGATLAAQQIIKLNVSNKVDTFIGIAGAFRGLWSCGYYPFNVWNSTCGSQGLSINSPFVNSLKNKSLATKTYSIKSWIDQVVCSSGTCTVSGRHSSQIDTETRSYSFSLGHFGLQSQTSQTQYNLIN
jgi:triacylglycerol lipase